MENYLGLRLRLSMHDDSVIEGTVNSIDDVSQRLSLSDVQLTPKGMTAPGVSFPELTVLGGHISDVEIVKSVKNGNPMKNVVRNDAGATASAKPTQQTARKTGNKLAHKTVISPPAASTPTPTPSASPARPITIKARPSAAPAVSAAPMETAGKRQTFPTGNARQTLPKDDFDFAANLSRFDKARVFESIRSEDSVRPEDRLVSINSPQRKLRFDEDVLDSSGAGVSVVKRNARKSAAVDTDVAVGAMGSVMSSAVSNAVSNAASNAASNAMSNAMSNAVSSVTSVPSHPAPTQSHPAPTQSHPTPTPSHVAPTPSYATRAHPIDPITAKLLGLTVKTVPAPPPAKSPILVEDGASDNDNETGDRHGSANDDRTGGRGFIPSHDTFGLPFVSEQQAAEIDRVAMDTLDILTPEIKIHTGALNLAHHLLAELKERQQPCAIVALLGAGDEAAFALATLRHLLSHARLGSDVAVYVLFAIGGGGRRVELSDLLKNAKRQLARAHPTQVHFISALADLHALPIVPVLVLDALGPHAAFGELSESGRKGLQLWMNRLLVKTDISDRLIYALNGSILESLAERHRKRVQLVAFGLPCDSLRPFLNHSRSLLLVDVGITHAVYEQVTGIDTTALFSDSFVSELEYA